MERSDFGRKIANPSQRFFRDTQKILQKNRAADVSGATTRARRPPPQDQGNGDKDAITRHGDREPGAAGALIRLSVSQCLQGGGGAFFSSRVSLWAALRRGRPFDLDGPNIKNGKPAQPLFWRKKDNVERGPFFMDERRKTKDPCTRLRPSLPPSFPDERGHWTRSAVGVFFSSVQSRCKKKREHHS